MIDLTPKGKCQACGDVHVVANSQKQECWQMCPVCGKHTNHVMTNIVKQEPMKEENPKNDGCKCGHSWAEHSDLTGVCFVCDCEEWTGG